MRAARVHHAARRRGGVAARGACAAAGDAADRLFMNLAPRRAEGQAVAAFRKGLKELGYVEGRNVRSNIAGREGNTIGCLRNARRNCWRWRQMSS